MSNCFCPYKYKRIHDTQAKAYAHLRSLRRHKNYEKGRVYFVSTAEVIMSVAYGKASSKISGGSETTEGNREVA